MEIAWEKSTNERDNLYGKAGHEEVAVARELSGTWMMYVDTKVVKRGFHSRESARIYLEQYVR